MNLNPFRRRRYVEMLQCANCDSEQIAWLWICVESFKETDDLLSTPFAGYCTNCHPHLGQVRHVLLASPGPVPRNMAVLLVGNYLLRLRGVAAVRDRASWARYWSASATPAFRSVMSGATR